MSFGTLIAEMLDAFLFSATHLKKYGPYDNGPQNKACYYGENKHTRRFYVISVVAVKFFLEVGTIVHGKILLVDKLYA
ncbi:hypothetical protein OIU14_12980 [Thalassobacter stenotrophicus]|uniref:hypothetical protein n=1 Tax=Thalassobacter stenotrophicus TaxID=266809 RepID=UPI0022A98765|nr:hypothetical protein [Thalassobacter stenotrophicus]UYP67383.1 hypothetical protein OIU14_12980 [Thalassobacter stenotrophicus]